MKRRIENEKIISITVIKNLLFVTALSRFQFKRNLLNKLYYLIGVIGERYVLKIFCKKSSRQTFVSEIVI